MKLSTIIKAARKAEHYVNAANSMGGSFPAMSFALRKVRQMAKFNQAAIQIADEQDELIALLDAQLGEIAQMIQEAHPNGK